MSAPRSRLRQLTEGEQQILEAKRADKRLSAKLQVRYRLVTLLCESRTTAEASRLVEFSDARARGERRREVGW